MDGKYFDELPLNPVFYGHVIAHRYAQAQRLCKAKDDANYCCTADYS